ncbi:MAG: hypothetical protein BGP01_10935 [Paludibacter sp. 47-17]|nr:MAG: hypothetical protein BGP01_10935 [Paludibacter sp. 47-17]
MYSTMKIKYAFVLFFCLLFFKTLAKAEEYYYFDSYSQIESMLQGKKGLSFKEAVFLTENAFYDNDFDVLEYNQEIEILLEVVKSLLNSNSIIYIYGMKQNRYL